MATTSEVLTINVLDVNCNPVYFRWKDTLGGWNYFLLEHKQFEALEVEGSDLYQTPVSDLATASEYYNVIKKTGRNVIKCGNDNLENYEFDLLQTIVLSPKIQLFTGTAGTASTYDQWKTIILNDFNGTKNTSLNSQKIELEFRYIEQYTISN